MGKFAKNYGKVVGKDAQDRPGWKGPGFTKKTAAAPAAKVKKTEKPSDEVPEPVIPIDLQQLLLSTFKNAFPEILESNELNSLLQDVKAALYERDFNRKSIPGGMFSFNDLLEMRHMVAYSSSGGIAKLQRIRQSRIPPASSNFFY